MSLAALCAINSAAPGLTAANAAAFGKSFPSLALVSATRAAKAKIVSTAKTSGSSTAIQSVYSPLRLTLQEALDLGVKNNPDLKLAKEDLKFRDLDREKADFFSDQQRDADSAVRKGWRDLADQQAQVNLIQDPAVKAVYQEKLDQAKALLEEKSQYEIDTLGEAETAELIQVKASVAYQVTAIGELLAEQKIGLLVRKDYYEVVKDKRLVNLKKTALQRAQSQFTLAKSGYDQGMRAKDDYLLAQAQVDLMRADLESAQNNLANAETELKKVLDLPGSAVIQVVDDFTTTALQADLTDGLKSGLPKRLEVRQAEEELRVAQVDFELTNRYYTSTTFNYREAYLTVEKAKINLSKQKAAAEADIRQAYSSFAATQAMLGYIQNTTKSAQDSLNIAALRYREGYGLPSQVMKNLNAEDASGTILEVIAAEEKLSEIEEKVTEIIFNYNLARANYLISICNGL